MNDLLDKMHSATKANVYIEGKKIEFISVCLEQAFAEHHKFSIKLDYDVMKQKFLNSPLEQINLIGKFLDIDFHQNNTDIYEFRGIISDVIYEAEEGKHGFLILEGESPTILLERGKRMDIFSNMNLQLIFEEVTDGIPNNNLSYINQPVYDSEISFLMQYQESDWEFLKRLSALSGETLFYTGRDLVFGHYKDWKSIGATYDKEIIRFNFGSRLLVNNFSHYQYLPEKDDTIQQNAPAEIKNSNEYLNAVSGRAKETLEKRPVNTPVSLSVDDTGNLNKLIDREKIGNAAKTIYIKGTAKTCVARIGRLLTIYTPDNIPEAKSLGTYRIIKVRHTIDQNNRYVSEFEGIPADLEFVPIPDIKLPLAESIRATVIKNNDPLGQGRVLVEFPFAQDRVNTTWLRVMTLDAGSSNEVSKNRGMVFIPEIGDQVMIGFEFGDPNRPYVMGSLFHGKNGRGGQDDNHIKSVITRSGHTIEFNDSEASLGITIKDKNDNVIHLDTQGKNIMISAPETIMMNAKNIKVNAEESIEMTAGENVLISAGKDMSESVGETHTLQAKNKSSFIQENKHVDIGKDMSANIGAKSNVTVTDDINVVGSKMLVDIVDSDILVNATGKITLKSGDIVDIAQ